jgi:FkbM family methyltransferase
MIDVGARGGNETNLGLSFGFHVITVDCQPQEFVRLTQKFLYNQNVTLLNICASDKGPELLTLAVADAASTINKGTLRHYGEHKAHAMEIRKFMPVVAMPLDKLLWVDPDAMNSTEQTAISGAVLPRTVAHIPFPVCAVKVDTQGHEAAVLQGLVRTLRTFRPVVYYEFERRFGRVAWHTGRLLKSLGYTCEPDGSWGQYGAPCAAVACDITCWWNK